MKNAKMVLRIKMDRHDWELLMDAAKEDFRSGHALAVKILSEYARNWKRPRKDGQRGRA